MKRQTVLRKNYKVICHTLDKLDLTVLNQKDASCITNWIGSAKELLSAHLDFENGFRPYDKESILAE